MSKVNFKISSRATILLGRENIAKAEGALIELIKNTYDADASLCYILFDSQNDTLYILDNGTGMTEDAVKDNWMLIGTENKRTSFMSEKKRIKSGEKGIGRFALDRLGSVCEMYTKTKENSHVLHWKVNWSAFEEANKLLTEIEADLNYRNESFNSFIPNVIKEYLSQIDIEINDNCNSQKTTEFFTGTILKISNLRDSWDEKSLTSLQNNMGYLIPPMAENDTFNIAVQNSKYVAPYLVKNKVIDEYDYRIKAIFDGEVFKITLFRNEFDLNLIPESLFSESLFQSPPFRKEDFETGSFTEVYTIAELLKPFLTYYDETTEQQVKNIGPFTFDYNFMKQRTNKLDTEKFFYKEISAYRKEWLRQNSGIRIYRDNFLVRPYGDQESDSFDWLNLNARNAIDPTGIGDKRKSWKVLNNQSQGTLSISRLNNNLISDKSSREGIIDNEYFQMFKILIVAIINIFEKDRAELGFAFRQYYDKTQEYEKAKREADIILQDFKRNKQKNKTNNTNNKQSYKEKETLVKALDARKQENEELMSELKTMQSLATNGLISTSIAHDLKSVLGTLSVRGSLLETNIDDKAFLNRLIQDIKTDDSFLVAWITVITNQLKKDKRTRKKHNIYEVISNSINILKPILDRKKIEIAISANDKSSSKRLFESDIDTIFYNLIMNSCEAFEASSTIARKISIHIETTSNDFTIHYSDNGKGLATDFKTPYDIFRFSVTSKKDASGNPVGTGLGMYIVASTINEYNGKYLLPTVSSGFALDITLPLGGAQNG